MTSTPQEPPTAAGDAQERGSRFFDAAHRLLDGRDGHCRFDDDRCAHLYVIDLTTDDEAALMAIATQLDLTAGIRIEGVDPDDLQTWARLRGDLGRTAALRPRLLEMSPSSREIFRPPPVSISFVATPESVLVAADLDREYGEFVALRVGALTYPLDDAGDHPRWDESTRGSTALAGLTVVLTQPLTVRTGDTVIHSVDLTNHSDRAVVVTTNGDITARVVDPTTGLVVGAYFGAHIAPLITFAAEVGETVRIPLLVGTTSFSPSLGFTIPAGDWQLIAPLDLRDGRQLISEPLGFTIVG